LRFTIQSLKPLVPERATTMTLTWTPTVRWLIRVRSSTVHRRALDITAAPYASSEQSTARRIRGQGKLGLPVASETCAPCFPHVVNIPIHNEDRARQPCRHAQGTIVTARIENLHAHSAESAVSSQAFVFSGAYFWDLCIDANTEPLVIR
jgi:hypothetical protein